MVTQASMRFSDKESLINLSNRQAVRLLSSTRKNAAAENGPFHEQRLSSARELRTRPFDLVVRLRLRQAETRTWFISRVANASYFAEFGLVGVWTPIGRVALLLKSDLKDGVCDSAYEIRAPRWAREDVLCYVPCGGLGEVSFQPGNPAPSVDRASFWPVPDETVVDARARPATARSPGRISPAESAPKGGTASRRDAAPRTGSVRMPAPTTPAQPSAAIPSGPPAKIGELAKRGFGLSDILINLDRTQLGQVTYPRDGTLVVTGGPGTGKTSVALYRAQFILDLQEQALQRNQGDQQFFREEHFLILLRKEHLKPYIKALAAELGLQRIQIETFSGWFLRHIYRDQIRAISKKYEFTRTVSDEQLAWGQIFDREHISDFLNVEFLREIEGAREKWKELLETFAESIRTWAPRSWSTQRKRDYFTQYAQPKTAIGSANWRRPWSYLEFYERIRRWAKTIEDRLVQEWGFPDAQQNPPTRGPRSRRKTFDGFNSRGKQLHNKIKSHLFDFRRILSRFYSSKIAREALLGRFGKKAGQAIAFLSDPRRKLCPADETACCWIVERLDHGSKRESRPFPSLPRYDHLIIDEAQFYPRSSLRFVQSLARPPRRAVTIVGDLSQAVDGAPGWSEWSEVVVDPRNASIVTLRRLYRCSREIYAFLVRLHEALGVSAAIERPREIDQFSSEAPRRFLSGSLDAEVRWISEQIDRIKSKSSEFSVAVVLRKRDNSPRITPRLLKQLEETGIPCREAFGEDMQESSEKVMITDADSVVGLEFDAVCVPCLDTFWGDALETGRNALWTAVTRARSYLFMSARHTEPAWLRNAFGTGLSSPGTRW